MGLGRLCWGGFSPFGCTIIKTSLLIFIYYLLSIGLTFYQNFLLKKIHFPLTVVTIHLVLKFLLASFLRLGYECIYRVPRVLVDFNVCLKRLSLVGISGGLDIAFSNWGTMFISVSLYTMTKSTAIVFILAFAILLKLEEKHWSLIVIVGMISGGLFLFTYKSTQFQLDGFLLILTASFLSGLRWSMAQLIAQKSQLGLHNPIDMIFHFQPFMIAAVLPFALYFEGIALTNFKISIESEEEKRIFYKALLAILIGGLMAFFMEIAEYLLVIHTSSLTLSVAGCAKEICTLGLAVLINKDPLTLLNVVGLFLCFIGIVGHVAFKYAKNAKEVQEDTLSRGAHVPLPTNGNANIIPMRETNIFKNDPEEFQLLGDSSDEEVWSK